MEELISYLKVKKNLINLLTLAIVVLALPLGVGLVRQQQIFSSRAQNASVKFLSKDISGGTDNCVVNQNGTLVATCKTVTVSVTAPDAITLTTKIPELVKTVYATAYGVCTSDNLEDQNYTECYGSDLCEVYKDRSKDENVENVWCVQSCHENWRPEGSFCMNSADPVSGKPSRWGSWGEGHYGEYCNVDVNDCGGARRVNGCQELRQFGGFRCDGTTQINYDVRTCDPGGPMFDKERIDKSPQCGYTPPPPPPADPAAGPGAGAGSVDIGGACTATTDCKDTAKMQCQDIGGTKKCRWLPTFGNPVCCTQDSQCSGGQVCNSTPNDAPDRACTTRQTCVAPGTGGPGANVPPGSTTAGRIIKFRLGENLAVLKAAEYQDYTQGGVVTNYVFQDTTPGPKTVFAQFKDDQGHESQQPFAAANITLLGSGPQVDNGVVGCNYDIKNDVLNLNINGKSFGTTQGKVNVNGQDLTDDKVDNWKDGAVNAHINNPQSNPGAKIKVKVTKPDGQFIEQSCNVNITQFDIGAAWMCGVANNRDIPSTTLGIFDMTPQVLGVGTSAPNSGIKVNENVTISKDGTIKNIKTKLKEGSPYRICVDPPLGVRTCSDKFTFSPGTVVTKLAIPIGDLNADGIINGSDSSILKSQWGKGTGKTGDFLQKGSVNGFDWGCLLQGYNKSDATEPF